MRVIRFSDPDYSAFLLTLNRSYQPTPEVENTVREILGAIRTDGDQALQRYTAKFGGTELAPAQFRVTPEEIVAAVKATPAEVRAALRSAHRNVRDFAKKSLRRNWSSRNAQGARVGERFDPFQRVGIYVPGGTAPLVSTAIMTVTFASAAKVPEIVVASPCGPDGRLNDALLFALDLAGATEIYRVGGAQAIGALAFGTETIRSTQKIFGPGNAYVVEAKRQVFGAVGVDLLPGPSEALVIADKTANATWVAADLLAQAEHGKGSMALLLTDSARMLEAVRKEIERQSATLARADHLSATLDTGTSLVLVKNLADAVRLTNEFAPEHVSVATANPEAVAAKIRTAGAIFVGHLSPIAGGDFAAGPSHELPTGGAGKAFAGLTADQFQRRTSIVQFDEKSLRATAPIIERIAGVEGLDAHARSASIRTSGNPERPGRRTRNR